MFKLIANIAETVVNVATLPVSIAIDAHKWQAGKEKPKVYGDKVTQEQVGKDGGPIAMTISWEGE